MRQVTQNAILDSLRRERDQGILWAQSLECCMTVPSLSPLVLLSPAPDVGQDNFLNRILDGREQTLCLSEEGVVCLFL